MTWNDYFLQHVAEAERKAQALSGFARTKQDIVAETFRCLVRNEFVGRRETTRRYEAASRGSRHKEHS
jgi:hypothetical protein